MRWRYRFSPTRRRFLLVPVEIVLMIGLARRLSSSNGISSSLSEPLTRRGCLGTRSGGSFRLKRGHGVMPTKAPGSRAFALTKSIRGSQDMATSPEAAVRARYTRIARNNAPGCTEKFPEGGDECAWTGISGHSRCRFGGASNGQMFESQQQSLMLTSAPKRNAGLSEGAIGPITAETVRPSGSFRITSGSQSVAVSSPPILNHLLQIWRPHSDSVSSSGQFSIHST